MGGVPEGHIAHFEVVQQAPLLVGHALRAVALGGRFASGAAAIDGRNLRAVDAWGKNLFYFFAGRRVLHAHLGMDGRFRHHRPPPAEGPSRGRRPGLRLEGPELTVDIITPRTCRVIDELEQRRIVASLGPDPLRRDSEGGPVHDRLSGYEGPIGAALLDQSLVAGIGNIYRAEVLFSAGVHPERPAGGITPQEWSAIWDAAVRMMAAGVRDRGRIVTVGPRDARVRDGRPTYVYGQRLCALCGSSIRSWDLLGREAWACETCQPYLPGAERPTYGGSIHRK